MTTIRRQSLLVLVTWLAVTLQTQAFAPHTRSSARGTIAPSMRPLVHQTSPASRGKASSTSLTQRSMLAVGTPVIGALAGAISGGLLAGSLHAIAGMLIFAVESKTLRFLQPVFIGHVSHSFRFPTRFVDWFVRRPSGLFPQDPTTSQLFCRAVVVNAGTEQVVSGLYGGWVMEFQPLSLDCSLLVSNQRCRPVQPSRDL